MEEATERNIRVAEVEPAVIADDRRCSEPDDLRFCVQLNGSLMEPRYFSGEKALVNKSLKPVVGDDVYFIRKGGPLDAGHVRKLAGFDGRHLRLRQHNPALEVAVPLSDIVEIYPCVQYEGTAEPGENRPTIYKNRAQPA